MEQIGEPLRPSALRRIAKNILEDQAEVLDLAIGLDGSEPTERCMDVEIHPHQLVYLESLTVQVRQVSPAAGGLR